VTTEQNRLAAKKNTKPSAELHFALQKKFLKNQFVIEFS